MNSSRQIDLDIVRLRLSVGFLGEKEQASWWASDFLGRNAQAFLTHIFGEKTHLGQFHGVTEAARRVHDDHVGVGRAFHLFRLPERIEQRIFDGNLHHVEPADLERCYSSIEAAEQTLADLAVGKAQTGQGPIRVGSAEAFDRESWIATLASYYHSAFQSDIQCFPYFTESQ